MCTVVHMLSHPENQDLTSKIPFGNIGLNKLLNHLKTACEIFARIHKYGLAFSCGKYLGHVLHGKSICWIQMHVSYAAYDLRFMLQSIYQVACIVYYQLSSYLWFYASVSLIKCWSCLLAKLAVISDPTLGAKSSTWFRHSNLHFTLQSLWLKQHVLNGIHTKLAHCL